MKDRGRRGVRRVVQSVLGLAVFAGLSVTTAGSALAAGVGAQSCRGVANQYTICFTIAHYGLNDYEVHIGIDVVMSQQDAQNIIDSPGEEFSATLYGDDPIWDDTLRSMRVVGSWAWSGGLSAEFYMVALKGMLNEDSGEADEIFGRVRLYVPLTGSTRTFQTTTVYHHF